MYGLYAVLALITVRVCFRLAEFSGGMEPEKNNLPFEEGYMLGLDAVPMVLAVLVLAAVHPGLVLRGDGNGFLSRKERKAEKNEYKLSKNRERAMRRGGKTGSVLSERDVDAGLRKSNGL